ncbi:MAG TPA: hypothetical protein VN809_06195, partial [Telmatospirillum sp.]|nr:hypothetical protein [Telmatospirillum sp.]
ETWTTSLRMLRMLVRMENLSLPDAPLSCIGRKSGDPCDTMSTFFDLTGTTLYTIPLGLRDTWITDYATWQQQQEATVPSVMLSNIVLKKIRALSRIISIILPILSYLAVLSFFAALGLQLKAQCRNISVVGAGICLIVVLTRVALLSFLDSVAMPSVNWLYLSPAVPAFLIFLVLAPTSFVVSLVRLRKISK